MWIVASLQNTHAALASLLDGRHPRLSINPHLSSVRQSACQEAARLCTFRREMLLCPTADADSQVFDTLVTSK